MALPPGTKLGPYEVIAPLGAGGMGEVYRARDARLRRDVALKVLPVDTLHDVTARVRLLREARFAATLNHPSICTVHEVGESEGHIYITMELIEGVTLAQKITVSDGGLAAENVVRYGAQIAAALAHAHDRHVIHRDLKGSNVVITPDGRVKVLDFGIARRGEAPDENDVTLNMVLTDTGAIVGTPQYLAPEVLRGETADERSDLWALGVLLYEAASGERPFVGATSFELGSAIMNDTPAELPQRVPAGLRAVITKCLAKEPGERYTRASEVRAALEVLERGSGGRLSAATAGPRGASGHGARKWLVAIPVLVTVMLIAAVLLWVPKGPPRLNPDMQTRTVNVPMKGIRYPGLSRDGQWIALPARDDRGVWGLYYMNASGGEVRPIAVDTSVVVNYADISPDGSQVVYSVSPNFLQSEIRLVSVLGGPVHTIINSRGGSYLLGAGGAPRWSPDGKWIGFIGRANSKVPRPAFWKVRPDGSERSQVFADSTSSPGSVAFAWSPDGKRIVWLRTFGQSPYNEIFVHDLATGRERQLTHDRKFINEVVWTPQDEILFSSNRGGALNLWIMRAKGGEAVQVTRGAGPDLGMRVSADGRTLLYLVQQPLESIGWWNVVTGENGLTTREPEPFVVQGPSPDGQRLAVTAYDPDAVVASGKLVVMNRDGGGRRSLVAAEAWRSGADRAVACDWSPDGRRIAWVPAQGTQTDSVDLHVVDVTTGEPSLPHPMVTRGGAPRIFWSSADTLLIHDQSGSFLYSLTDNRVFDRTPDSVWALPNRVPGWRVFIDLRRGWEGAGIFLAPGTSWEGRLVQPKAWVTGNLPYADFLYCWPESLGFSRTDLPSARLSPVAHVPPKVRRGMLFYPTRDGRVIYWVESHETSKLVCVENLHK
jgi:Tol biopolymer transport system component